MTVAFNNTSLGEAVAWEWRFGDGIISNVKSPSYAYPTRGPYSVSLRGKNVDGIWSNLITKTIEYIVPVT